MQVGLATGSRSRSSDEGGGGGGGGGGSGGFAKKEEINYEWAQVNFYTFCVILAFRDELFEIKYGDGSDL